jgi:hypothetical protein
LERNVVVCVITNFRCSGGHVWIKCSHAMSVAYRIVLLPRCVFLSDATNSCNVDFLYSEFYIK